VIKEFRRNLLAVNLFARIGISYGIWPDEVTNQLLYQLSYASKDEQK